MRLNKLKLLKEDSIGYIIMDFPKNLNAIDEQMLDELFYAFDRYENDGEVSVVVLRGTDTAFSSGGDIRTFYKGFHSENQVDVSGAIDRAGKVALFMKKMSKVIIASVSGPAVGAGACLALACDTVICSEDTQFIWAFVNLGLVPDTGGTYLLSKAIGVPKTFELVSTGRPVGPQEALSLGIVSKICRNENLELETKRLALRYVNGPLKAYANIKRQIFASAYADFEEYLNNDEKSTMGECLVTDDFREGVYAFVERRKPVFCEKQGLRTGKEV